MLGGRPRAVAVGFSAFALARQCVEVDAVPVAKQEEREEISRTHNAIVATIRKRDEWK
jgi:hypothetical protein